jgi:hypothetical protein
MRGQRQRREDGDSDARTATRGWRQRREDGDGDVRTATAT